jgi:hypothetical protein
VIEDCLLGSRQLEDLHDPLDLYDKQRTDTQYGVLGGLERLKHRAKVLQ